MRVLVTGGAGYIGAITAHKLLAAGCTVAVLDNLEKGYRAAVPPGVPFYQADLRQPDSLALPLREFRPEAVVHFAAYSLVGESVQHPGRYFKNNVLGGLHLLEAMAALDCRRILFSSTAAVYGDPARIPVVEDDPTVPTNPYGDSKLAFEKILTAFQRAYGFQAVSLRYFNAAGAWQDLGEDHRPETHLIPLVLEVALGRREQLSIYGDDYDTPDGTAIRDYIHVSDLADAHVRAVEYLAKGQSPPSPLVNGGVFNLGNGAGYSVREVLETARRVTGRAIPAVVAGRRPGDPPRLVAGSKRARQVLGWKPRFPELEAMIADAWAWKQAHPDGYA
ncbi:UDP-glucose 4-epimerase GalE [bacterium]|nr:UDP-glucose 4-epimerase GalE [bacterium]